MTMRILSVEDEPDVRDQIQEVVRNLDGHPQLEFAANKTEAFLRLAESHYDVAVLDLRIPIGDDVLNTAVEHGLAVLSHIKAEFPGLPVIILTASPSEELIDGLLDGSHKTDVWSSGTEWATIRFTRKNEYVKFEGYLRHISESVTALSRLDLRKGRELNIPAADDRLIRIAVRDRKGVSYNLQTISGGLSGATVYRLQVIDEYGKSFDDLILKIGDHHAVRSEEYAYKNFVNRLSNAATPRFHRVYNFGGGNRAAISYSLATGYDHDLYAEAVNRTDGVARTLEELHTLLKPWSDGVHERPLTLEKVRRFALKDDKRWGELIDELGLNWVSALEQRSVQVKLAPTHGDLHGRNVLVNGSGQPTIIDYNDIAVRPPSFDWVTLELSLIFHVDGPARGSGWPSLEACDNWADVDAFAMNSKFKDYVIACRYIATSVAPSEIEIAACAYAYLSRQLKYKDTNKEVALRLLNAVRRMLM